MSHSMSTKETVLLKTSQNFDTMHTAGGQIDKIASFVGFKAQFWGDL